MAKKFVSGRCKMLLFSGRNEKKLKETIEKIGKKILNILFLMLLILMNKVNF